MLGQDMVEVLELAASLLLGAAALLEGAALEEAVTPDEDEATALELDGAKDALLPPLAPEDGFPEDAAWDAPEEGPDALLPSPDAPLLASEDAVPDAELPEPALVLLLERPLEEEPASSPQRPHSDHLLPSK